MDEKRIIIEPACDPLRLTTAGIGNYMRQPALWRTPSRSSRSSVSNAKAFTSRKRSTCAACR